MSLFNKYAVSDVYEIVMHMSKEDREKIPENAMKFLKENRDKGHHSSIDFTKPIEKQKLSKDTASLLSVYIFMSFCENKEDKLKLIEQLKEFEIKEDK